jgi:hypothetical protein
VELLEERISSFGGERNGERGGTSVDAVDWISAAGNRSGCVSGSSGIVSRDRGRVVAASVVLLLG